MWGHHREGRKKERSLVPDRGHPAYQTVNKFPLFMLRRIWYSDIAAQGV